MESAASPSCAPAGVSHARPDHPGAAGPVLAPFLVHAIPIAIWHPERQETARKRKGARTTRRRRPITPPRHRGTARPLFLLLPHCPGPTARQWGLTGVRTPATLGAAGQAPSSLLWPPGCWRRPGGRFSPAGDRALPPAGTAGAMVLLLVAPLNAAVLWRLWPQPDERFLLGAWTLAVGSCALAPSLAAGLRARRWRRLLADPRVSPYEHRLVQFARDSQGAGLLGRALLGIALCTVVALAGPGTLLAFPGRGRPPGWRRRGPACSSGCGRSGPRCAPDSVALIAVRRGRWSAA